MSTASSPASHHHVPLGEVIDHEQHVRRRRVAVRIVIAVVVVAAIAAVAITLRPKPLPMTERYRTAAVAHGTIVRTVDATGRVEARTTVDVGAQVSGRLDAVEVDFNDRVQRGQVLARFDTQSLAAQAAQAEASVVSARATLRKARVDRDDAKRRLSRSERLHAKGMESDESLEAAQSGVALAQAAIEQATAQLALQKANAEVAKTNLGHAEIFSPISGVVISRNIEAGQTVVTTLQSPVLFVIAADLSKMQVVASIDEADIGEVKPGQHATFTVDAYRDREFEASLSQLRSAAQITQNVVTYEAVLDVDNPELLLRPGMTASIEIETATVDDALQVPNAALRFTPEGEEDTRDRHTVWVLRDDELVPLHVTPGVTDGTVTEVVGDSRLQPDDELVVDLTPAGRKALEGKKRG